MAINKEIINRLEKLPKTDQETINRYIENMVSDYEFKKELAEIEQEKNEGLYDHDEINWYN